MNCIVNYSLIVVAIFATSCYGQLGCLDSELVNLAANVSLSIVTYYRTKLCGNVPDAEYLTKRQLKQFTTNLATEVKLLLDLGDKDIETSMIVDILTRVNGACQLFEYKNCGKIEDVFECAQSEIMSGALTLFDWIDHICADRRDIIVQLQDVTACWPGCRKKYHAAVKSAVKGLDL